MEETAPSTTVEQAEPQGNAALGQDTSSTAPGDSGAATPESFGSVYRQHVLERAERLNRRAGLSSADRATSARDEQQASDASGDSRPGATDRAEGGTDGPDRLTRAQRKALKTGQPAGPDGAAAAAAPPESVTETAQPDPIVSRVESVERTVAEGLSRLEGLLKPGTQQDSAPDPETEADRRLFGDNAEFERRAQIALHGSQTGQYLDVSEADELAKWATNREARDFAAMRVTREYHQTFSAMVHGAAAEFGIPAEVLSRPNTSYRDIFQAFVAQGAAGRSPELETAQKRITELEAANRLLADSEAALQQRLPASARSVLTGGTGASTRAAASADRTRMSGRQLMQAGLQHQSQGRPKRPGAR